MQRSGHPSQPANEHPAGPNDPPSERHGYDLPAVAARYGLTTRETQLLEMLTRFRENREIAEALQVRDSTLQKHYQNIFRKLGVTSRWEIMRLLLEGDTQPLMLAQSEREERRHPSTRLYPAPSATIPLRTLRHSIVRGTARRRPGAGYRQEGGYLHGTNNLWNRQHRPCHRPHRRGPDHQAHLRVPADRHPPGPDSGV